MTQRRVLIKMAVLVAISVAAFAGMGAYGVSNTSSTFAWVQDEYRTLEQFRDSAQNLAGPLNEIRQLSLSIVLAPNASLREEFNRKQLALTAELDATLNAWKADAGDPLEGEAFQNLRAEWVRYKRLKDFTIARALERSREEAYINATGAEREQFQRVNDRLEKWMRVKIDRAETVYQGASAQHEKVFWTSSAVIVLLTLIVGSAGFLTTRGIVRPIEVLKEAARRIANREEVKTIAVHSNDELGDLARSTELMAAAIQSHMTQQRETEAEVRALNTALHQRVEELHRLHATQEQRVVERTAQLSAANTELAQGLAENTEILDRLRAAGVELTRSNQELEQFAYVASHDLQEPLRKISSFSQLLAAQYKGRLDAEADEFIGYMVDGARRMQALIQNLLAYSRLGRKGEPFALADTNAVLQQALANLQGAIEESGAIVKSDPLPTVLADEVQLVQLFQNLIGNAIKFRSAQRPLIQIRAEPGGPAWTFFVSDDGIGIDPKFAERIFVIFQRLHSQKEYPGTGIGLAFCKKIVERHGGRIWVEPQPYAGTVFCFTLPRTVTAEQPTKEYAHES